MTRVLAAWQDFMELERINSEYLDQTLGRGDLPKSARSDDQSRQGPLLGSVCLVVRDVSSSFFPNPTPRLNSLWAHHTMALMESWYLAVYGAILGSCW